MALFCQGILSEASRLHKMNKLTIASPGKLRSKQIWAQLGNVAEKNVKSLVIY